MCRLPICIFAGSKDQDWFSLRVHSSISVRRIQPQWDSFLSGLVARVSMGCLCEDGLFAECFV